MSAPARRSRRWMRWTGVVLILGGLGVAGYLGWELYGTTWVAVREQQQIVAATERVWADNGPEDGTGASSAPDGDEQVASDDDVRLAEEVVALVRIPAFGSDYVVPVHAGTSDEVLSIGFGAYGSAPAPGGIGNFAIGGHRVTHGEPLREMPDLKPGDEVVVVTDDRVFHYELDTAGAALTVGKDEGWVTAPDPLAPDGASGAGPGFGVPVSDAVGSTRLLTLVTCAELFHTDDRLVAFGHLVSESPA